MARVVWCLVGAALISMAAALVWGGFKVYLTVQAVEAAAAGVALLGLAIRFLGRDPRGSRWPPLLPLAAVALTGSAKNFWVVACDDVPVWLAVLFLSSVGWFFVASWRVWRSEGRALRGPMAP